MNHDESLSPQLTGLAASLANLAPAGSQLNRDVLMYRAGWAAAEAEFTEADELAGQSLAVASAQPASAGFTTWVWPSMAAVFAMISCSLAVLHFRPEVETPHLPVVTLPAPDPEKITAQPVAVDANTYMQLRKNLETADGKFSPSDRALRGSASGSGDSGYQRLRQQFLGG